MNGKCLTFDAEYLQWRADMRERKIQRQTLRLIDANLNRAREAVRVIEDIVRFRMDDAAIYGSLRKIRLGLGDFASTLGIAPAALLAARRSSADVGREALHRTSKIAPDDPTQIISRNFARLQEALRSLEETARAVQPAASADLQAWRFAAYDLQQACVLTLTRQSLLENRRLYALLSEKFSPKGAERTARLLLKGGVDIIQIREKAMSVANLIEHTKKIAAMCRRAGAISIANDRVDVAMAADADGVHLGPEDMPIAQARSILGANKIIGATTRSLAMARRAVRAGADYVAIGPARRSSVAAHKKPISAATLQAVLREIKIPVFVIGGIDSKNLPDIMKSGVRRIAACTALTAAGDPAAAARFFLKKLSQQVPVRSQGKI